MTTAFQTNAFQTNAFQVETSRTRVFEIRDPRYLTMRQWADSIGLQLDLVIQERIEQDWQGWASRLILGHEPLLDQAPNPYQFQDWRTWVDNLNRTLVLASY